MQDTTAGTFESKDQAKDAGPTPAQSKVSMWLAAIDAASREESDWRKEAEKVIKIYRAEDAEDSQTHFNILHSNIETVLPAVYNSTPIPDIRRRFNDPGAAAKQVSDILERAISYCVDQYDFDGTMRNVLFDSYVTGRGVARVRYVPYFTKQAQEPGEQGEAPETDEQESQEHVDDAIEPEPGETVAYEEVTCEYVPYAQFRRGPGRTWDDVRWIAFEHFLGKEQLEDLNDKIGPLVPLDMTADGGEANKGKDGYGEAEGPPKSEIFGRARVWEIWDKDSKTVLFIAPGYAYAPLKETDDPLELTGFFPIPRPVQPLMTPGNMTPMCPYHAYRRLAEELNDITRRIQRLIKQLRVRGIYASPTQEIEGILNADDGELVPAPGLEAFLQGGGLEKAIAWWPLDPTVKALAQLYNQREQVKATIYEVTGLSDILRGNTQASETATAQQIKSQWGSLRIQRMQADVARFARDLFRLKAEIIAQRFSMQTLMLMTGIELLPMAQKQAIQQQIAQAQQQAEMAAQQAQAQGGQSPAPQAPQIPPEMVDVLQRPSLEEVEKIIKSDLLRSYKIDIESDSTIRADLTRNKQEVNEFIQGTAAYAQAVGPAVAEGMIPKDLAIEIYASFARLQRLGKSAEDAIDRAAEGARKEASQPQPQKPNPEMIKAQADIQKQQADLQLKEKELQIKQQDMAARLQLERQKAEQDAQLAMQKAETEREIAVFKAQTEAQVKQQQAEAKAQQDAVAHQQRMAMDAANFETEQQMARERHVSELQAASEANAVKQKQEQEKASKPRRVKFVRGMDGRIAGAELN